MKFKSLLLLSLLATACVTNQSNEYPRLTHDLTISEEFMKCEIGQPYYFQIETEFDSKSRDSYVVGFSYQCEENDGARKTFSLGRYSITKDRPCENLGFDNVKLYGRIIPVSHPGFGCGYSCTEVDCELERTRRSNK